MKPPIPIENPALKFKNFHEFLEQQSRLHGESPCITDGETGEEYSYRQTNDIVNKTASFLSEIGIKRGDRFATLTRNCPEFLFLYLASMKMGALIVPLVVDLPVQGLEDSVKRFDIKVLFCGDGQVKGGVPRAIPIKSLLELIKDKKVNYDLFSEVLLNYPGSLYFSSGTTGIPKGIPQSPKNLLTAATALIEVYNFTPQDTQMGILPCYHTALATYGFWPSLWVGSNFVLFERFHKSDFWKNLAKYQISFVEVVPTILSMLLNSAEDISHYDLHSLKFIGSGSAPLPPALHNHFEKTFGVAVANQYGLSETAPTHFNPPERSKRKDGSIGKAIPRCSVKVVNETGGESATNEIGEIVMRGDSVVDGYYADLVATESAFREGWFYTGDLGFRDVDGFYFLAGRKKEMINRGGAKIYPQEVDNVLLDLPTLREAATIGVPDEMYGEKVVSYVVPKDGGRLSIEEMTKHCLDHLPPYKCPEKIFFIDEIPKTASGKIIRRILVERYVDEIKNHD